MDTKGTEVEAKGNCSHLDSSSTLITIASQKEQKFIEGFVRKFNGVSDNMWIGLEWVNNGFKWMDGNDVKYENWDENAIKDGNSKCVQMSTIGSNIGQWMDDLCQKKYLIACQKKQASKTVFEEQVKNLTNIIESQQQRITSLEHSSLPIGFLYIQFPNQSPPHELWSSLNWTEVTKSYAGLFFRAEGGNSESFGQIQQANQSVISDIWTVSSNTDNEHRVTNGTYYNLNMPLNKNGWTQFDTSVFPYYPMFNSLSFHTTSGEVRPRNTAIKIWKRIK